MTTKLTRILTGAVSLSMLHAGLAAPAAAHVPEECLQPKLSQENPAVLRSEALRRRAALQPGQAGPQRRGPLDPPDPHRDRSGGVHRLPVRHRLCRLARYRPRGADQDRGSGGVRAGAADAGGRRWVRGDRLHRSPSPGAAPSGFASGLPIGWNSRPAPRRDSA